MRFLSLPERASHEIAVGYGDTEGNVKIEKDKVTFLYKIAPGAMNKSYGINVARLAHLPEVLLKRAKDILKHLENNGTHTSFDVLEVSEEVTPPWQQELEALDPLAMTPMDALKFLYDLKKKMK